MVIVTFFVDDHGSCTMQVAKRAKFLSRSERAILAAYKQLEADGVIIAKPSHSTGTVASWVLNNLNEANQLAPTHSACPTQRQQGRVAGSQALCWSRPSISAHKSSARLGLAHGFLPRLRIGDALKHARPRYFHCAGKLRGSVRQLAAPGISVPPSIMEVWDSLLLCARMSSAIRSSSCVCLCPKCRGNP